MGVAYIVISEDDITAGTVPPVLLKLAPGRRTVKWRGRSFNLAAARVVGIG